MNPGRSSPTRKSELIGNSLNKDPAVYRLSFQNPKDEIMKFFHTYSLPLLIALAATLCATNQLQATPPDTCEMLQMQALANGKPVDCHSCHRPSSTSPATPTTNLSLIDFLSSPMVQRQIDLTQEQLDELKKLKVKKKSAMESEDRHDQLSQLDNELKKSLIPFQVRLIKQIRFNDLVARYGFSWTVSNRPFVEDIGTTKSQKAELLKIKKDAEEEIESTKLKSIRSFEADVLGELDSKQKRIAKSLMGEKVELKVADLQRQMQFLPSKLDLLNHTKTKARIEVSTNQDKEIKALYQRLREAFSKLRSEKGIPAPEMRKLFVERRTAMDKELKSILMGRQWDELERIQFATFKELFGISKALSSSPFAEKLGVSKRQLQRINVLQLEYSNESKNDAEQIRTNARKRMLSELNRKQRDVIHELENQSAKPKSSRL